MAGRREYLVANRRRLQTLPHPYCRRPGLVRYVKRANTEAPVYDSENTLQAIGLHFNAKKCKFLRSPGMSDRPLKLHNGQPVHCEETMIFLGILLGFHLTCVAVLAARMVKVSSAFWGFFKVLRQTGVSLKQRLKVFDCFVISRWRWLSPAVRPIQAVQAFLKKHTHKLFVCDHRIH